MVKPAYVISSFNDATDNTGFKGGTVVLEMDAGRFGNYEHAGLVREATADEIAAAKKLKAA